MKALILAISLLLMPAIAHAERWELMSHSEKLNAVSLLELDSIKLANGHARAWIAIIFIEPAPGTGAGRFNVLKDFDCKNDTAKDLDFLIYAMDGTYTGKVEPKAKTDFIVPGSNEDSYLKMACGFTLPTHTTSNDIETITEALRNKLSAQQ